MRGEQAGQAALLHFGKHPPVITGQHPSIKSSWQKGADPQSACAIAMGAKYCKRIGVLGAGKGIELPLPKATVITRGCIHL
ncbi:hypothetical protein D3C73_1493560 [compost metagenome]